MNSSARWRAPSLPQPCFPARRNQAAAKPAATKHTFGIEGDRFVLDGKPFVIRSGEMHYARIPREYWRDRMKKMRAMGLNTLCMYSFWNLHEPRARRIRFLGRPRHRRLHPHRAGGRAVGDRAAGPVQLRGVGVRRLPVVAARDAGPQGAHHRSPLSRGREAVYAAAAGRGGAAPGDARRAGDPDAGGERVRLLRQGQGVPQRDPQDDRRRRHRRHALHLGRLGSRDACRAAPSPISRR